VRWRRRSRREAPGAERAALGEGAVAQACGRVRVDERVVGIGGGGDVNVCRRAWAGLCVCVDVGMGTGAEVVFAGYGPSLHGVTKVCE
jgi:hypothetical protein